MSEYTSGTNPNLGSNKPHNEGLNSNYDNPLRNRSASTAEQPSSRSISSLFPSLSMSSMFSNRESNTITDLGNNSNPDNNIQYLIQNLPENLQQLQLTGDDNIRIKGSTYTKNELDSMNKLINIIYNVTSTRSSYEKQKYIILGEIRLTTNMSDLNKFKYFLTKIRGYIQSLIYDKKYVENNTTRRDNINEVLNEIQGKLEGAETVGGKNRRRKSRKSRRKTKKSKRRSRRYRKMRK
jgi:hypothetical protein